MCSGAIILSRVKRVVYGAIDPKGGCAGTLMNLLQDERFNHQSEVTTGVLEEECGQLLSEFFQKIAKKEKAKKRKERKHQIRINYRIFTMINIAFFQNLVY